MCNKYWDGLKDKALNIVEKYHELAKLEKELRHKLSEQGYDGFEFSSAEVVDKAVGSDNCDGVIVDQHSYFFEDCYYGHCYFTLSDGKFLKLPFDDKEG